MSVVLETPEEHISEHKKLSERPEEPIETIVEPEPSVYEMAPSSDEDDGEAAQPVDLVKQAK